MNAAAGALLLALGLPSRLAEEPDPPDWVLAAWNARATPRIGS